jgi:phage tail P2-like protein
VTDSLLPPNATALERHTEQATARLADVPVSPMHTIWNPDTCAVELLPWLAWAVGVSEWSSLWPEHVQRASIRASILVRRHSGTAGALRRALEALDIGLELKEWFQQIPAGDPGTAKATVQLEAFGLPEQDAKRLDRAIDATKNVRSHLDVALTGRHDGGIALAATGGEEITVTPYWIGVIDSVAERSLRSAWQFAEVVEITPPWVREQVIPSAPLLAAACLETEVVSVRPLRDPLHESTSQFNGWYEGYTQ